MVSPHTTNNIVTACCKITKVFGLVESVGMLNVRNVKFGERSLCRPRCRCGGGGGRVSCRRVHVEMGFELVVMICAGQTNKTIDVGWVPSALKVKYWCGGLTAPVQRNMALLLFMFLVVCRVVGSSQVNEFIIQKFLRVDKMIKSRIKLIWPCATVLCGCILLVVPSTSGKFSEPCLPAWKG